jgi:hypothetical protein
LSARLSEKPPPTGFFCRRSLKILAYPVPAASGKSGPVALTLLAGLDIRAAQAIDDAPVTSD